MSFSSDVKAEVATVIPNARHCQIAELAAIFQFCASYSPEDGGTIKVQTENVGTAKICFTLLQKTCRIRCNVCVKHTHDKVYYLELKGEDARQVSDMLKLQDNIEEVSELLVEKMCCRRSFVSGAFLSAGSMNNPIRSYHFEIVCTSASQANMLMRLINSFGIESKMVQRKRYYVVYLKEGEQIIDMLNIMEAHQALLQMENTRIVKEMRNTVNRRVNCETANITKTVNAAVKQVNDIIYIRDAGYFGQLSEPLRQMAEVRLANPEAALKELGSLLSPPVGKSGVNHRLRKLSEIAENLRKQGIC
ncbi:MAG: DNA-binding protein WhiA [Lachnospiraceae bacterium]|nr:DNA-binding protein WhiA [Lachnospiraceae bacterium]